MSVLPFDLRRTLSTSAFDSEPSDLYNLDDMHNDEWMHSHLQKQESSESLPAGSGLVNRKLRLDVGSKVCDPETPMRRHRGNSLSAYSGLVTPQSAGRSFSLSSLSYTPTLDQALPSPTVTPLGTPLEMPLYNPFDMSCDPKMSQWDFSSATLPNHMRSSTVSLSSMHQNIEPTKPASAMISRQAARSASVSSVDLRSASSTRKSSVSSGINPFYCPPQCLLESPAEKPRSASYQPFEYAGDAGISEESSNLATEDNLSHSDFDTGDISASLNSVDVPSAAALPSADVDALGPADLGPNSFGGFFESSMQFPIKADTCSPSNLAVDEMSGPNLTMNRNHSSSVTSNASAQSDNSVDQDKPFVCDLCAKGFRRMEHLRRHTKTHTRERPYTCTVADCGRKFSRTDNLKAHILTHAKRTGRNKYVEGLADLSQSQVRKKRTK